MKTLLFSILAFFLSSYIYSDDVPPHLDKGLNIHLICYRNGVGLNRDIDLLTEELIKLGHHVTFVPSHDKTPKTKADINIFLDVVEEYFFPFAEKNYLIPNPEWCFLSREQLAKFDLILCKTKEAERIFKPFNPRTIFIGFISKDCLNPSIRKNYKLPIHIAGASIQKGTKAAICTWINNPQFPPLFLLRHKSHFSYPETDNIKISSDYLTDPALEVFQNGFGLHICPSETEGFGHYIGEAMSCENVIVTVDAPPMNEFILDKRCLVKYSHQAPWRYATNFYVDPDHLDLVISNLLSLSEEDLREIGKKNRKIYLKNVQSFRKRLAQIFQRDFAFDNTFTWEKTNFIWNLGIASQCDIGMDNNPIRFFKNYHEIKFSKEAFQAIKEGDLVWIRCKEFPMFCKQIFPELKHSIILLIADGDQSFPSALYHEIDIETLLESNKILHVFAQNCDYKGPSTKISHFPIGIDFHTIAYRASYWGEVGSPQDQESILNEILTQLKPTYLRKVGAFVDFHHADSIREGDCRRYLELGEDRTSIFNQLKATSLIAYDKKMRRSDLWRKKGEYAFSISPHGNGLDCHRTWEDLALGCIVIVKTSVLDPLYEGLPVVIVKDWSEVNEANLKQWLQQYGDAFTNPAYREKLTNSYWLKKVLGKRISF